MLESDNEEVKSPVNRAKWKLKLEQLKEDIEKLNIAGEEKCEDSNALQKEYEKQEEYKDKIIEIESILMTTESTSVKKEEKFVQEPVYSRSKLPEITIKEPFAGNIEKWPEFWGLFDSLINSKPNIPKVQKFIYLKEYLTREALDTITGIPVTEDEYDNAVQTLKIRYDDKNYAVTHYISQLINLSAPTYSAKSLRLYHTECDKIIRCLSGLNMDSKTYACAMAPILTSKLPDEIMQQICRTTGKESMYDLRTIMAALRTEVEILERSNLKVKTGQERKFEQRKHFVGKTNFGRSSAHFSGFVQNSTNGSRPEFSGEKSKRCVFCCGQHATQNCTKFNLEERQELVKYQGRCFRCLGFGHRSFKCRYQSVCENCKENHHTALCRKMANVNCSVVENFNGGSSKSVLLQTANVIAANPVDDSKSCSVRILFDTGSSLSFVRRDLFQFLNLSVMHKEDVNLVAFGNVPMREAMEVTTVELSTPDGALFLEVWVKDDLCGSIPRLTFEQDEFQVPPFSTLALAETKLNDTIGPDEIQLLVGCDQYGKFVLPEIETDPLYPSLTAQNTRVGWLVFGRQPTVTDMNCFSVNVVTNSKNDELWKQVSRFHDLESLGIANVHEEFQYDEFQKTISRDTTGRYTVDLPVKENIGFLPEHRDVCMKRIMNMLTRNDTVIIEACDVIIKDQLIKNIVEPCVESKSKKHYLPHHAVKRDSSTTPVRMVFDGSFSYGKRGTSINQCLFTGPSLLPDLFLVLIRFRKHPVALTGDIEKAFLQVGVSEAYRDLLRFLWINDCKEVVELRFARVPFGLNCSPFLLNATIKKHLNDVMLERPELKKIVEILLDSLYVDDLVASVPSVNVASELITSAKRIFDDAKMNLRKFNSNAKELVASPQLTKVLGLTWDPEADTIRFSAKPVIDVATKLPKTKRSVLKILARIFDPLGLVSPVIVTAKILFSDVCDNSIDWDTPLEENILLRWNEWLMQLSHLDNMEIKRCLIPSSGTLQIHGFCDGSGKAYGAAVYLRVEAPDGSILVNLITAKARVAPKKSLSIPRLELMGALILSRIVKAVVSCFPLVSVNCWTDSMTALYWVKQYNEWKQWVQFRVREIRANSPEGCHWRHICSELNPADLASRGISAEKLSKCSFWLHGPSFLSQKWEGSVHDVDKIDVTPEVNSEIRSPVLSNVVSSPVVKFENFSSYQTLIRTVVYLLRAQKAFKGHPINRDGVILASEYANAEKWVLCQIQQGIDDQPKLNTKLDKDGILRCMGRLGLNKNISYSMNNPVLLPKYHHVTRLIVQEAHYSVMHSGAAQTLAFVRQKFWIPSGRRIVRTLINSCVSCKRLHGKAYDALPIPPLPEFRVESHVPAFTSVGIDFFGPIYIKNRNDEKTKIWICLFTCASSRAVHLELSNGQSTEVMLGILRRFVARRGCPALFVSDNAKTFVLLNRYFKFLAGKNIEFMAKIKWQHIIERGPWWGGFYERLNGLAKAALKKTLLNRKLNYEETLTLVQEVEAMLNSRPLTYVGAENIEPLTPAHLLIGRPLNQLPEAQTAIPESNLEQVRHLHRRQVLCANAFWRRWKAEYLTLLREHAKKTRGSTKTVPKVGDVVLVETPGMPRLSWTLGRIVETIQGRDTHVRAAVVKTKGQLLKRSVRMLYPLEVCT